MQVAALSDKGLVRQFNEDSILLCNNLYAVADGMGGHQAGDIASKMAVNLLRANYENNFETSEDSIKAIMNHVNFRIYEAATEDDRLTGMGTTITALFIDGDKAYLAHVGDSRCYIIRNKTISQISQDHSYVGRLVAEGNISEKDAMNHPYRSFIDKAFGIADSIDIDIKSFDIMPGDIILLCSDGLSSYLGADEILHIIKRHSIDKALKHLYNKAMQKGGADNISIVLLQNRGAMHV